MRLIPMADSQGEKPRRLAREVIYESSWVNLYADKVQFPAGRVIDRHHFLDFERDAVAAIAENEDGQILMVHAYRYVTDTIEWEIPAGVIDKGETVLDAAQREVREETGYETEDAQKIYTYAPMNGIANQVFHIVHCKALSTTGQFDRNEVRDYTWFSVEKIKTMIKENTLRDGFTLTALLLHLSE
ncbi:MAG: ADP-ribose pyrophosphatase [Candidatus Latescibacterota bacterium]|jgi:ADP-ribose pyrophosphatase